MQGFSNYGDTINLQEKFYWFSTWCYNNLLPVNINNCSANSVTKKNPLVFSYKINNIINLVNSVRYLADLDILFSCNFLFLF